MQAKIKSTNKNKNSNSKQKNQNQTKNTKKRYEFSRTFGKAQKQSITLQTLLLSQNLIEPLSLALHRFAIFLERELHKNWSITRFTLLLSVVDVMCMCVVVSLSFTLVGCPNGIQRVTNTKQTKTKTFVWHRVMLPDVSKIEMPEILIGIITRS